MKKGQVFEAIVDRVDFPGKGIVTVGDETVIIKNCLPGQKIKFRVSKARNGKAEGRLLEVIQPSPLETGRPCSRFGVCGGCIYLSLPYSEQLKMKEEQMKRLLDTCLSRQQENWCWEGIKGSPAEYEYRNKMEFSFGDEVKDGPLALGMHRRGSFYDVVTVEDCRIVDADYRLILRTVREYFAAAGLREQEKMPEGRSHGEEQEKMPEGSSHGEEQEKIPECRSHGEEQEKMPECRSHGEELPEGETRVRYFHRMRHEGYLRHLLVRKASRTGEILAALVTTSQDPWGRQRKPCAEAGSVDETEDMTEQRLLEGFRDGLLALEESNRLQGRFAGILHIVNDSLADVVQNDRTDVLYGQEYFYEELLGLRFKVSTFSFFQTNSLGAEVLYETVRKYIGDLGSSDCHQKPGKVVFDLYSGTGTIAQLMAPAAGKVIGVEIVEEAVEAARRNAEENGLENCEFIAGDVLKVLDTIEDKPDLIILDPPRDGIHPKALPKIIAYGVKHIIYISCKPTSLARDLEVFMNADYSVEKAAAVDQFPWTANCELIALLTKREQKPK